MEQRCVDIDHVVFGESQTTHVALVEEEHVAMTENPAISIVEPVNRRVVLVGPAQTGETQHVGFVRFEILLKMLEDEESSPSHWQSSRRIRMPSSANGSHRARVSVIIGFEIGENGLDLVANERVVASQRPPLDRNLAAEHGVGERGDDPGLGATLSPGGFRRPRDACTIDIESSTVID